MTVKTSLFWVFALCFTLLSCEETIENPLGGVSNEEVVQGLKEALRVGTDTSVTTLNKTDGYYKDLAVKILLPPEAQVIQKNIELIPGGNALLNELILKINRSAEDAAIEAKPIFVDAITGMSISDGLSILNGSDTAATQYLRTNTYNQLKDLFHPKIQASLAKPIVGGISAESSYKTLIKTYNDAASLANLVGQNYPIVTDNSLSEYTTRKGLNGLFLKIADEEKAIRTDPVARVTDILVKVFSK